jgi:hypothetical protein
MIRQFLVGQDLLFVKDSRSQNHSVGLLDECSARRTELYLTTHNTLKRQTPMSPAGFETAIPANERPETQALDREATAID